MYTTTHNNRTGFLFSSIRLLGYGFVVVLLMGLSGCKKDECRRSCTNGYIDISTTIMGGRITGNSFDPDDQIGLYVAVSPGIPDPDNYAYNVPYTFDGTRWTGSAGLPLPWPGTALRDIYAYWP